MAKRKKLTLRQLFFIASVLILTLAFLSKNIIREIEAPFLNNIMKLEGESAAALLANASIDAIISEDIPYLQTIVEQIGQKNNNVLLIEIYSAENILLVSWQENTVDNNVQYEKFEHNVTLVGEFFGKVVIHWRTDLTINQIEQHASFLSYIVAAIGIILALSYLILTHYFVFKPIQIIDNNLLKLNAFFQNPKDHPTPQIENIATYNARELHNLLSTVSILKNEWLEKEARENKLVKEVALRKNAERKLLEHKNTLQLKVEEKTKDLLNALDAAEQANKLKTEALQHLQETRDSLIESEKMASLGALVAGVCHEVNTPLGIAHTATSLINHDMQAIEKKLKDNCLTQSNLKEAMIKAQDSSSVAQKSIMRIIDLMNNFKQMAVDQSIEQVTSINIYHYIEDIMHTLQTVMKKNKTNYQLIGDKQLEITTIPGALAQIITNLVNNSILHGFENKPEGSIVIQITEKGTNKISLVYTDDGAGMQPEVLANVFEPFYTTARNNGGTGLGMSIVYNLVTHKVNGSIELTSVYGQGINCTIVLPRKI